MNQSTHAWLAVEAYRKIDEASKTSDGKKKKLAGLAKLLGANLRDVVVAAWLPDSLIKDMMYGHVFKNSVYEGDQKKRFRLCKKDLRSLMHGTALVPKVTFDLVDDSWWDKPYRVKDNGGHLPARVIALCQTARDMLKMGDKDVVKLTGIRLEGAKLIADSLLSSPRDIAIMMWMVSHYIADAHMPFHCDNRGLASTTKQNTHCDVEDLWGKQVPKLFHASTVLKSSPEKILAVELPEGSEFSAIKFSGKITRLKSGGDPWKEAVYICRTSFAASFALVPPDVAPVDDRKKRVSLKTILKPGFCGEERFWEISRAIMADSVNAIARFWQDIWLDFIR